MWEHVLDVRMVHCFFDVGCLMPYACIMFEAVQDLTAHMVPMHFARKPAEYAGRVPLKHSRIDLGSDMKEAQNAIVEASASASCFARCVTLLMCVMSVRDCWCPRLQTVRHPRSYLFGDHRRRLLLLQTHRARGKWQSQQSSEQRKMMTMSQRRHQAVVILLLQMCQSTQMQVPENQMTRMTDCCRVQMFEHVLREAARGCALQ